MAISDKPKNLVKYRLAAAIRDVLDSQDPPMSAADAGIQAGKGREAIRLVLSPVKDGDKIHLSMPSTLENLSRALHLPVKVTNNLLVCREADYFDQVLTSCLRNWAYMTPVQRKNLHTMVLDSVREAFGD